MGIGAASVEPAAWRRVHGARYLAPDHLSSSIAWIRHGNGSDQGLRIGVERQIDQVS